MSDSSLIVPDLLTEPQRKAIFTHFNSISRVERSKTNHFDFALGEHSLFVKYGDNDLLDEASTQSFFYALAQKDSSAPRIPAVYSAFREGGRYFLVMERVALPTVATCAISDIEAVQGVASAVKWLLDQMPSVPSTIFGRISYRKTCVWHRFFKEQHAPVPFVNSKALGKYVDAGLSRRRGGMTSPISLPDDLAICHSDICKDNFLCNVTDVTPQRICIIDFQHISVLPKPFQTYGFFNISSSFAANVGHHLGHQPSDLANKLTTVSAVLQQTCGDADLGLNEYGEQA